MKLLRSVVTRSARKDSPDGIQRAQVVLRKAHNSAGVEAEVRARIQEFAARGFRALGLAVADGSAGEARLAADPALVFC